MFFIPLIAHMHIYIYIYEDSSHGGVPRVLVDIKVMVMLPRREIRAGLALNTLL